MTLPRTRGGLLTRLALTRLAVLVIVAQVALGAAVAGPAQASAGTTGSVGLAGSVGSVGSVGSDGRVPVTLTLFWGDGCPKCEAERRFLERLRRDVPELRVEAYEVWKESAHRARFQDALDRYDISGNSVPLTIVRDRVWIGFTDPIRDDIRRTVEAAARGEPVTKGVYGRSGQGTCRSDGFCPAPEKPKAVVDVPLIGAVDLGGEPLIVSTLVIGFVDGINPCSLWVISILLAIVIRTGSRRRVVAIGLTFLLITAAMYGVFIAGIYSALTVIGYLDAIRLAIGVIAGVFGVLAVKDYFWFRRGPSLSIPESRKPGIYHRMREVAGAKALLPALGATALLAVGVSLLETPCTAGFPVIWTGLLASNEVGVAGSVVLFLLYMVPFLLDELIVFAVAVVTMRATKLQEEHGRVLKLVAGTVMLALAVTVVFFPAVMEDVLGATLVFVVAIGAALVIHLAYGRWAARRGHGGDEVTTG